MGNCKETAAMKRRPSSALCFVGGFFVFLFFCFFLGIGRDKPELWENLFKRRENRPIKYIFLELIIVYTAIELIIGGTILFRILDPRLA